MSTHKLPNSEVYRIIENSQERSKDSVQVAALSKFAKQVVQYRKSQHLTSEQFARKCGVGVSVLSRVESGYQNITIGTICKILSVTGGNIQFTIGEDNQDEYNS